MENKKKYLEIINDICHQIEPGKKTLQKLFYLIERKGVDLGLNYSIHFFGPYSSRLDDYIHMFEGLGSLNINTSGTSHIISVSDEMDIESVLNIDEKTKVNEVIEFFSKKTPYELEAITTIDYVANTMLKDSYDKKEILSKVKEIKGDKFKDQFLEAQYSVLQEEQLI